MTKWKWALVLIIGITLDVIQIALNFAFGAGVLINRFIIIGFQFALTFFLALNGINVMKPKRLASLLAGFGIEIMPALDMLPGCTGMVVYNWVVSNAENKIKEKIPGAEKLMRAAPLVGDMDGNSDSGERRPPSRRVTIEE